MWYFHIILTYYFDQERGDCCLTFFVLPLSCYVNVLWLFLAVPWVSLQCVIVFFHDHTHLLFTKLSTFDYSIPKIRFTQDNYIGSNPYMRLGRNPLSKSDNDSRH